MGNLSEGQGVYIISNKSMPGLVKVGSTKNIKDRLKTLSGTSVPTPFRIEYFHKTTDGRNLEQKVHIVLTEYRERENREFFRCSPDLAKGALIAISHRQEEKSVIPDSAAPKVNTLDKHPIMAKLPNNLIESLKNGSLCNKHAVKLVFMFL